jgi:hypothetical protein
LKNGHRFSTISDDNGFARSGPHMPPGVGVQFPNRDRLHDVSNVSQWFWEVKPFPLRGLNLKEQLNHREQGSQRGRIKKSPNVPHTTASLYFLCVGREETGNLLPGNPGDAWYEIEVGVAGKDGKTVLAGNG